MEKNVAASVESPVESSVDGELRVQMLGPFAIRRDGLAAALPASRKVRALFAYLALAPRPVGRSQLCELLWEIPNDPRGELRGCLSKIRSAVEAPGRRRVITHEDTIQLDLDGCFVDAVEVSRAIGEGIETLTPKRKRALVGLFAGDFLQGLELSNSPAFGGWLTAQRRRFRGCHAALLEQLSQSADDDEALIYREKWLQLAPFDGRAHETMLMGLARRGRIREGEEHLAATSALFEAEGLDATPLRAVWRTGLAQCRGAPTASEPNITAAPDASAPPEEAGVASPRRASIAVMPFADQSSEPSARGGIADALAYDVTARLAKLRSMFVIAQGSVFALHERGFGSEEAGRMLNVDYVLGGTARLIGERLSVSIELIETRTARLVWSEILNQKLDDALIVLEEIGNRIVASIAGEIETVERNRAILRPPNSLSAWEAHHRGLWHMYRFTQPDNVQARHFFESALRLDPTFARAYAGLSFTHFQDAFQAWGPRAPAIESAYAAAGQSLLVDDRDPAAHWAMGRALWLRGRNEPAIAELERSIDLSPNFSLAHYTLAFVHSQAGDPAAAIVAADRSRSLSPFDPLLFATMAARAMALARMGRYEESADWAVKAAARPNAHVHIHAIAAYSLALAGLAEEARAQVDAIRRISPRYSVSDFFAAFQFDAQGIERFRRAAERVGME
ncbi:MAG: transcriptional regulator [Panacagrimonas sp.]